MEYKKLYISLFCSVNDELKEKGGVFVQWLRMGDFINKKTSINSLSAFSSFLAFFQWYMEVIVSFIT